MRSINIKGLFSSSKLQNQFFLCQDSISSPLPVFSQNPSLLRRNPRSPPPLSGSMLSKRRLSVTNCFFLPQFSLERGCGPGNEEQARKQLFKNVFCNKTGAGQPGKNVHLTKLGQNSAWSFTLCFFVVAKLEMET